VVDRHPTDDGGAECGPLGGVLAHEVTRTGRIAAATPHALDEARLVRFAGDVDHDVSGVRRDVDHDVAAVSEGGIPR
jgi:hypothetical protein